MISMVLFEYVKYSLNIVIDRIDMIMSVWCLIQLSSGIDSSELIG